MEQKNVLVLFGESKGEKILQRVVYYSDVWRDVLEVTNNE